MIVNLPAAQLRENGPRRIADHMTTRRIRSAKRDAPARRGQAKVPPRSFAERSAKTRERVIRAAIECIAESGYKNATVTQIAARSGVSWGGIQHQFGNKAAIIQAVLDHALDEFMVGVQRISTRDDRLETRVGALVEGAWRLVSRPVFLAFLEIVLGHRRTSRRTNPASRYTARFWKVVIAAWDHLFGDLDLPQDEIETARRVTFSMLGGMAIESAMRREPADFTRTLEVLQDTLLRLLREPPRRANRRRGGGGRGGR